MNSEGSSFRPDVRLADARAEAAIAVPAPGPSPTRLCSLSTTLPRAAESAGQARAFTAKVLAAWQLTDELTDDILLACSELVTNAIEHGDGVITLLLSRDADAVELRVGDQGGGTPAVRPFGARSVRNRGLAIVQALSSDWGWVQVGGGKTVWALFRVPG